MNFGLVVLGIFLLYFSSMIVDLYDKQERIKLNDINVGDKVKIKGENFIVKGYSSSGNVEIAKIDKDSERYVININPDDVLVSHNEEGKRKYISIDSFKGTVGGNYLDKIKFK